MTVPRPPSKLPGMATVLHVNAFEDNYIWVITDAARRFCALVDPGDDEPVRSALAQLELTPVAILITHHHRDHVGGIEDLLRDYDVPVFGPARERIPALTDRLQDGNRVDLPQLGTSLTVFDVPGHTTGHIAYVGDGMVFCGDTLFSAGCGRLFEGTAAQMHASLTRLAALAESTKVYCAHEYTLDGLRFAAAVEPQNQDVHTHMHWAQEQRSRGIPTLPSTIGLERRINPFLRTAEVTVREAVSHYCGRSLHSAVETFAELRRWKDAFRG